MKKLREMSGDIIGALLLLTIMLYCVRETEAVKEAVAAGLERCSEIIIPSLYAMLVISSAFVRSGLAGCMPSFIRKAAGRIAGMKGSSFPVFLFSQIAGYPAGAGMLINEYRYGRLTKRSAELLMGVCFGAGPAFIYGCISSQLYGSPEAGRAILISAISSNIIIAAAISFLLRKEPDTASEHSGPVLNGAVLTDSVMAGGRAAAGICFMIMLFSVITQMLGSLGITGAAASAISSLTGYDAGTGECLFASFLDITSVCQLHRCNYELLPAVSALVSFGGVCVMFQIASISGGELSIVPLLTMRTAAAALSFGICRLIMPFFTTEEAVTVSAGFHLHRAESPIPSAMLLLMTAIVMKEYDGRKKKKFSE